ncbi:hypothetical protein P7F88_19335 [Vibrio hannami]|uniref:hypothetical protein n=1 Tax=Vibrio hannami TaxID=2717094 RepID=UPI00241056C4|nr:hypothetical protein [Vibrio hannami]MDG3088110.1 hypothetical protein [Vibrio hannami]
MGSKSNSNQSTTYNTTTSYEYNQLDGGAIEASFDFAEHATDRVFDYAELNTRESFDFAETLAEGAFSAIDDAYSRANQATSSSISQMSDLVKSTQTQGATDLIAANQKTTLYMMAGMAVMIIMIAVISRGRK